MTLAELRDRCQRRFRETEGSLVSTDDWDGHINAAMYDFVSRALWPSNQEVTVLEFSSGDASKALPEGVYTVEAVRNLTEDESLSQFHSWDQVRDHYDIPVETGTPEHFLIWGGEIYPFFRPGSDTEIEVHYIGEPPRLQDDDDTPDLPERYQEAIIEGALSRAYMDDDQQEKADRHQSRVEKMVEVAMDDLMRSGPSYPVLTDIGWD